MDENAKEAIIDSNIPYDTALAVDRSLKSARETAISKAEEISKNGSSSNGYLATGYFCDGELVIGGKAFGTGIRPADPSRGPDDNGTNYAALAIAKVLQSVRSGKPAGTIAGFPKGEYSYKGGLILESKAGWRVYIAYSGFPAPEDDIAAARSCADSFIEAMKYYAEFSKVSVE
jgi:hypothetical protein